MTAPIGILGGTFDPVHNGHLRLALECLDTARLGEVRLVPAHTPPHRRAAEASPAQRLRMIEIATADVASLAADDREIRRGGVSYTVHTLRSLREESGGRPLCLITGMDAFRLLHTWREWTSLLDFAHIILAGRPGGEHSIEQADVARIFKERLTPTPEVLHGDAAGRIYRAEIPHLEISATGVRALVAAGRSPRFLVPDGVIEFIAKERLYQTRA